MLPLPGRQEDSKEDSKDSKEDSKEDSKDPKAVEMFAKEQEPFAFTLRQLLQQCLRGLRPLPSILKIGEKERKKNDKGENLVRTNHKHVCFSCLSFSPCQFPYLMRVFLSMCVFVSLEMGKLDDALPYS